MVDRAALEMRSTRKGTGGSNPSLSATLNYRLKSITYIVIKNRSRDSNPVKMSQFPCFWIA
ncbi:hypothetical protein HYPGJ_31007 [Hyphomicrobium sp. GJ21]|nr:hypothetical protein HYPGJ_31007 [Hyphomicrobium sp. GJ21]